MTAETLSMSGRTLRLGISALAVQSITCLSHGGAPGGAATLPSTATSNLVVLGWAGFRAAASFTFDDSQPSHIAHYAELQAVGVPMTFYVSSGNSSQPNYDLTWTQAVKDGHEIGNHSVHHCHADLTGCSFGAPFPGLGEELDTCSSYIPQHTGQAGVWTGAAPFGDPGYEDSARSRFLVYRGVAEGMIASNGTSDPFNLPTHMVAAHETAQRMNAVLDEARTSGKWVIFTIHSVAPTSANWYNPVDVADLTGSMGYAKSVGDVWVGSVAEVGAYWLAQRIVSAAAVTTSGRETTWTWTLPAHFPRGKSLRVRLDGGGTLRQGKTAGAAGATAGQTIAWKDGGYYEVALDAGSLTLSP